MDALIRKVCTYGGYDERWRAGRLFIEYYEKKSFDVAFECGHWMPLGNATEHERIYLISAAAVGNAIDNCTHCGYPAEKIFEFLPEDRSELIPAELFRTLMDDIGLGIDDAVSAVVRSFGASLAAQPEREWLTAFQPRTAFLDKLLRDELKSRGLAWHDAYDSAFRTPTGAVEEGTEITLSVVSFGGVESAALCIYGDGFSEELSMQRAGNTFSVRFAAPSPAALFYKFKIGDSFLCPAGDGHSSRLCGGEAEGFRLTVYKRGFKTPEKFRRSIMYQVFPDRFGFSNDGTAAAGIEYHRRLGQTPEMHGSISEPVKWQPREGEKDYAPDDFYGGTLKGITARLPYLKELGIGTLYLNPIVEARSNHRYDTSSYENVDPILGGVSDYVNLCAEADKLGIGIINDGVFSHTGADSVYFDRFGSYGGVGAHASRQSKYFGWFDFRSYPDDYRCWWGFKDLPEVNEEDKSWQDYIIRSDDSIVKLWLRRGASGWRLDVSDELPDDVLALIRDSAKAEKPDCAIIGEVWEDAVVKISYGHRRNYALGYSLDSVMNYPFRNAVISFARGETGAFALRDFLLSQQHNYPMPMYMALMNLLSSHDVERLHSALGADCGLKSLDRASQAAFRLTPEQSAKADRLQKLCAAIQYCTPGVPCLYYGDEECLDGAGDPFNRAPFEPSGSGLHNFYVGLGRIRNSSEALKSGSTKFYAPTPDVLMILREAENDRILCVINRGSNVFNLRDYGFADRIDCTVPPCSAEIYKLT